MSVLQWALLEHVAWLTLGVALLCFVVGELTGNVSQVDKLWSIVPVAYAWMMTAEAGYPPRAMLMSAVATVWGIRLTYNFSRHGAYQWKFWTGHEDYRWVHVRQFPALRHPLAWKAFHLGFICLYQNALLLLLVLPIIPVVASDKPLGVADWLVAALYVGLVGFETIADQQQWNFQSEKKRRAAVGQALDGRYATGFIHDGLWARSRHPNYFAEQSIWVTFFLFSVVAAGFNWSVLGCVLLILLFQSSAKFSEGLQAQKYPAYAAYRDKTSQFIPL